MAFGFSYNFPALKGLQAGREYYVAMCPLRLLPKLFLFNEAELPPDLRAQRSLNTTRVPEICEYILNNRSDYAFSALTASIDGDILFEPSMGSAGDGGMGVLSVPMSARFIINDGQHRRAAIEAALAEQPDLGEETIAVVFYLDAGLCRSQQLFADLNQHAIRPTRSIGILYDRRAPLAMLVRDLVPATPCFYGRTEFEKTTISNRSTKLFTLSGIHQATGALLGKRGNDSISEKERAVAHRFWRELSCTIPEWKLAASKKTSTAELRRDYIHAHNVTLHAIGLAGRALVKQHPKDWPQLLAKLGAVDWSRSNVMWEGRAMLAGRMSRSWQSIQLTSIQLKRLLDLPLSPAELQLEEKSQTHQADHIKD